MQCCVFANTKLWEFPQPAKMILSQPLLHDRDPSTWTRWTKSSQTWDLRWCGLTTTAYVSLVDDMKHVTLSISCIRSSVPLLLPLTYLALDRYSLLYPNIAWFWHISRSIAIEALSLSSFHPTLTTPPDLISNFIFIYACPSLSIAPCPGHSKDRWHRNPVARVTIDVDLRQH